MDVCVYVTVRLGVLRLECVCVHVYVWSVCLVGGMCPLGSGVLTWVLFPPPNRHVSPDRSVRWVVAEQRSRRTGGGRTADVGLT